MPRSKKWNRAALGFVALALIAVLFGRPTCGGPSSGGAEEQATVLTDHRFPVHTLAFSADGSTLTSAAFQAFAGPAGELEVTDWNVATARPTGQRIVSVHAISCLTIAPGGRDLAAGEDRGVRLWHKDWRHERPLLSRHRDFVSAVAYSADGHLLATADEQEVTVWDVAGGRPTTLWKWPSGRVGALAFAPDGRTLAGGGADRTIRLWDLVTGQQRGICRGHHHSVAAVAFSPDGRSLASGDLSGVTRLWDLASAAERAALATPPEEVTAVAFAPGGGTLAVAVGHTVQLWDVSTQRLKAGLEGHARQVSCLAYSPDGTRLASGSHDRTVRLWEVARQGPSRP
jgi:WD40 repeat protein